MSGRVGLRPGRRGGGHDPLKRGASASGPEQRRTRGQTQLDEIIALGFTSEQASVALAQCERDPNRASCLLLEEAGSALPPLTRAAPDSSKSGVATSGPEQGRTRGQTQLDEIIALGFTSEQASVALAQSERDPNRASCLLLEQAAAVKVPEHAAEVHVEWRVGQRIEARFLAQVSKQVSR